MSRHALAAVVAAVTLVGTVACGSTPPSPTASPSAAPPTSAAPTTSTSAAPTGDFAPWSIERNGTGLNVSGAVPDERMRAGLADVFGQVLRGAALKNELVVTPGVRGPDASGLGGLFDVIGVIPDFALVLKDKTLTLTGTAPSDAVKTDSERYASQAFPGVAVVNRIRIGTQPPPPAGASCATLHDDALVTAPITFATGGSSPTSDAKARVAQLADRVKACAGVTLTVVGHTDATGSDAINVPLSVARAKAIADQLISDGVDAAKVTSSGVGSAQPVATDATAAGRAENRRVQITVG